MPATDVPFTLVADGHGLAASTGCISVVEIHSGARAKKWSGRSGVGGVPRAEVWSNGGGKHSAAIAALIVQGRLPKPDYAVIVDTDKEKQTTWDYLERVIRPALASVGVEMHTAKKTEFAKEGLFDLQQKHLLIPAFSGQTGQPAKLSNFCSDKWKRRVRDRWLRAHGVKEARIWLGFTVDEPRRWMPQDENPAVRLPLVKDVPLRKAETLRIVSEMGWPVPPGSNCWMCPNQRDDEWLEIRTNRPDEFVKAVLEERRMREKDPLAFFHRSCVPLDEVDFTRADAATERACNSGECFL